LLLGAIVVAFSILGAWYSTAVPLFEAPDEVWHFSFIRILATEGAIPVQSTATKDVWLRESGQPPFYYLLSALPVAVLDTSDFPGFVRFNSAHPAITPGLVSDVDNMFIHTPHEDFPYRGAVLAIHLVRLLSVLMGAITVVTAYLLGREIAPRFPAIAVASAALTAFNPHFIFISGVVNNDVAAAMMGTAVLWLVLRLRHDRKPVSGRALALGAALGLAILTKLSLLALLPVVAIGLLVGWWRDRDWRTLLMHGLTVFGTAAVIGSWWYIRNWRLYGDPLAWGVWTMDLPPSPIGPLELVFQFGHVATSYWSPYDDLLPPAVFLVLGAIGALAAAGWLVRALVRARSSEFDSEGLALAALWLVLLLISLVKYMATTPSDEGRLLFPGVAVLSLLVVLGLDGLVTRPRSSAVLGGVSLGLLALCVAVPITAIEPRFSPPVIAAGVHPDVDARFTGGAIGPVRLLGVQIEPEIAVSGEVADVTLFWEALSEPPDELRAVVQLWTVGGRLLGQHDTSPAGAVYPPDIWQPGDVVHETHHIAVGDGPAAGYVTVVVMDGDTTLGRTSTPPAFLVSGPRITRDTVEQPLDYELGDCIELLGSRWDSGSSLPDDAEIMLYWRARCDVDEDYMVFVHALDRDGNLLGQGDGPPLAGDLPTSLWPLGEIVADAHELPGLMAAGSPDRLVVGLYRPDDESRLPAFDASGSRVADDAIQIVIGGSGP
jgi:4-amino-4-deoxy-L-arabinose transferase-like glycosyltransferase